MDNNLLISIIVPVYKVEPYLSKCIESILAQTYKNLEIILVDDGSPDRSGEICDEYAAKDSRIMVIHQKNQGVSAARNAALDIFKGDVIGFVDSDDWIDPEMYEKMLEMMLQKDLDVVFCAADMYRDGKVVWETERYYEDGAVVPVKEVLHRTLMDDISGHCWNRLCRRHCFEHVRFPNDRIYEDVMASHLPFVYAKKPVGFLNTPYYKYRDNNEGITGTAGVRAAYYIFVGRLVPYRYAQKHVPEAVPGCLAQVTKMAMHACNVQILHPEEDMSAQIREITDFLRENKQEILRCPEYAFVRKAMMLLYLYCKPLYTVIIRLIK